MPGITVAARGMDSRNVVNTISEIPEVIANPALTDAVVTLGDGRLAKSNMNLVRQAIPEIGSTARETLLAAGHGEDMDSRITPAVPRDPTVRGK